jgi:phosphoribosylformylglycinamidine synthase
MAAMGGNLGMEIDLGRVPVAGLNRDDKILFSESAARFIVTLDPAHLDRFEACFDGLPHACIGRVTESAQVSITGLGGTCILSLAVSELKRAWKKPFGALI